MSDITYPCPCCGYLVFSEAPGSYAICPLCYWEDDIEQLRYPSFAGGANAPSLIDSQRNTINFGAMEQEFLKFVRSPRSHELLDVGWRPLDLAVDEIVEPFARGERNVLDPTRLYWWRSNYWLL